MRYGYGLLTWDMAKRYLFQFSLWDTGSTSYCALGATKKCFNSLYEIRKDDSDRIDKSDKGFNSLYEIRAGGVGNIHKRGRVSILFMRYYGAELVGKVDYVLVSILFMRYLRKASTVQPVTLVFQFSLWDTFLIGMVLRLCGSMFQFSLWDTGGWKGRWWVRKMEMFQFSLWDTMGTVGGHRLSPSSLFQFSLWDTRTWLSAPAPSCLVSILFMRYM